MQLQKIVIHPIKSLFKNVSKAKNALYIYMCVYIKIVKRAFLLAVNRIIQTSLELIARDILEFKLRGC